MGALVVLGSWPAAAQGASVLDQSQESLAGGGFVIGSQPPNTTFFTIAQTFTAGQSGPLAKVELHLSKLNLFPPPPDLPITVEIRTVSGGDPTATVLATATIPAASIPIPQEPAWVPVTFAAPATVAAGTQYAIVAYTLSGYGWSAGDSSIDNYAGGSRRAADSVPPTTSWSSGCGACTPDMAFRTFVGTPGSPPVAAADAYSVIGGATLSVAAPGVLANDTDADSDPLTAQLDSTTTRGALALDPNGSFTYTPGEDTVGTDSFTYHANDGTADSAPVTVTITVRAGCEGQLATQVGTSGADKLGGSGGNDVIVGLGGNDTIEPGSGNDIVCGGSGRDGIEAGSGNDSLHGGSGNDTLDGGSGLDRLFGDAGVDQLFGGGDNDALDGGAGSPDNCDGEGGTDTATACEVTSHL